VLGISTRPRRRARSSGLGLTRSRAD